MQRMNSWPVSRARIWASIFIQRNTGWNTFCISIRYYRIPNFKNKTKKGKYFPCLMNVTQPSPSPWSSLNFADTPLCRRGSYKTQVLGNSHIFWYIAGGDGDVDCILTSSLIPPRLVSQSHALQHWRGKHWIFGQLPPWGTWHCWPQTLQRNQFW